MFLKLILPEWSSSKSYQKEVVQRGEETGKKAHLKCFDNFLLRISFRVTISHCSSIRHSQRRRRKENILISRNCG
jgi:hypothetical protein